MRALIIDVPVIHRGYLYLFLSENSEVDQIFLMGRTLIDELNYAKNEKRRLPIETVRVMLKEICRTEIVVLEKDDIPELKSKLAALTLVDDAMSRKLLKNYFGGFAVKWLSVFLRWDEENVYSENSVEPDEISSDPFDQYVMLLAQSQGKLSPNWWRQVGAMVIKGNGEIGLSSYNHPVTVEYDAYALGDIRDLVKAGEKPELTSDIHAEQEVIATAAREGIALEGTRIYVTVFPCPICAKLIARSGIKACYYMKGHSTCSGEKDLREAGVKIIKVLVKEAENDPD